MICTEKEAKKKCCPMVRTHIAVNRDYYGNETAIGPAVNKLSVRAYCIASACMMWRWCDKRDVKGGQRISFAGYCGLSGNPT